MADEKITVVARIKAKPGKEQIVKDTLMALVAPTRSEAGCINYDLHQAADDKGLFLFYENWISKKDLDEHLATPYLKDFLGKAGDILAEPVEITLWKMSSQLKKT